MHNRTVVPFVLSLLALFITIPNAIAKEDGSGFWIIQVKPSQLPKEARNNTQQPPKTATPKQDQATTATQQGRPTRSATNHPYLKLAQQVDQKHGGKIREISGKYGIDRLVILALATAESGGDPKAQSPTGPQGLMQLAKGTQKLVGVNKPFDPAQSLEGGAKYLAEFCGHRHSFSPEAIGKYYDGHGTHPKNFSQAAKYHIAKVTKIYNLLLQA